jgi:S-adenosylmethionine hydrolase
MKSVILNIFPTANIVDLCHELGTGDVQSAAFALLMAFPYLPEYAIIAAVVDPGVGTARLGVAVEIGNRIFVGPDNGLLSWVVSEYPPSLIVNLVNDKFFLKPVSSTFHGRDIFAPVAAYLAKGLSLAELGPQIESLTTFPIPEVIKDARSLRGEVVYIDRFGNLVTNIKKQLFEEWVEKHKNGRIKISFGSVDVYNVSSTYGDAQPGHPVVLFGSSGYLEVAVNGGSAADYFDADRGAPIYIYHLPS